jgi:hypothetical protein
VVEEIVKKRVLAICALSAVVAPSGASAQREGVDRDVTCRVERSMAYVLLCSATPKLAGPATALRDAGPLSFPEQLKVEARESADRYVRKGQCDKARMRAEAAGDPAFIEEIARRCMSDRPG